MEYSCWNTRQKRIPGTEAKRCKKCRCNRHGPGRDVDVYSDYICSGWPWKDGYFPLAQELERSRKCKLTCESFEYYGATADSYR